MYVSLTDSRVQVIKLPMQSDNSNKRKASHPAPNVPRKVQQTGPTYLSVKSNPQLTIQPVRTTSPTSIQNRVSPTEKERVVNRVRDILAQTNSEQKVEVEVEQDNTVKTITEEFNVKINVCVLGESGSGKTSFVSALIGKQCGEIFRAQRSTTEYRVFEEKDVESLPIVLRSNEGIRFTLCDYSAPRFKWMGNSNTRVGVNLIDTIGFTNEDFDQHVEYFNSIRDSFDIFVVLLNCHNSVINNDTVEGKMLELVGRIRNVIYFVNKYDDYTDGELKTNMENINDYLKNNGFHGIPIPISSKHIFDIVVKDENDFNVKFLTSTFGGREAAMNMFGYYRITNTIRDTIQTNLAQILNFKARQFIAKRPEMIEEYYNKFTQVYECLSLNTYELNELYRRNTQELMKSKIDDLFDTVGHNVANLYYSLKNMSMITPLDVMSIMIEKGRFWDRDVDFDRLPDIINEFSDELIVLVVNKFMNKHLYREQQPIDNSTLFYTIDRFNKFAELITTNNVFNDNKKAYLTVVDYLADEVGPTLVFEYTDKAGVQGMMGFKMMREVFEHIINLMYKIIKTHLRDFKQELIPIVDKVLVALYDKFFDNSGAAKLTGDYGDNKQYIALTKNIHDIHEHDMKFATIEIYLKVKRWVDIHPQSLEYFEGLNKVQYFLIQRFRINWYPTVVNLYIRNQSRNLVHPEEHPYPLVRDNPIIGILNLLM